ncbi:MAG TPA: phosphotransferase [Candidatus Dormibacteraeota bacterium]
MPAEIVLASGRDADLIDLGDGRLLRRPRQTRPLEAEVALMRFVRSAGYPVPEVFELRPDGMVLERVPGPTMLDDLAAHPWRVGRHARTLAALHRDLHRIPAADGLRQAFGNPARGDVVVHGDLHPGNVLLSPTGPVVIDWSSGGRGPAGADVADAWLVLAAAAVPGPAVQRALLSLFRRRFLAAFLRAAGREEAARNLPAAAARRSADLNLAEAERAAMLRIVARHSSAPT